MPFTAAAEYHRVRLRAPIPRDMLQIIPASDPAKPCPKKIGATGQRMWAFQEAGRTCWVILTESGKALMMDQLKLHDYIEPVKVNGRRVVDCTDVPVLIHRKIYNDFYNLNAR